MGRQSADYWARVLPTSGGHGRPGPTFDQSVLVRRRGPSQHAQLRPNFVQALLLNLKTKQKNPTTQGLILDVTTSPHLVVERKDLK